MTPLKIKVVGALLLGSLAAIPVQQHRHTLKLRRQVESLRQQAAQCCQLAEQNRRLARSLKSNAPELPSELQRELLQLRGEIGRLRREQAELASTQPARIPAHAGPPGHENSSGSSLPPSFYLPRNSWNFAGFSSVDSALQSVFWALASGDLGNVTNTMSPREQTRWLMNEKPRNRMAELIRQSTAVRVLDIVTPKGGPLTDDSDAAVVLWWLEGGNTGDKFVFKRDESEWKLDGDPFAGYSVLDNMGCIGYNVLDDLSSK